MKNLKVLAVALLMLFGLSQMNAQAFEGNGDKKLQAGFSAFGNGIGLQGTFDYGIHQYFSLGAGAEFYFHGDNGKIKSKNANFYVFGRANAHLGSLLDMPSEMDLYPGIDLGLLGNDFGFGGHLGFRYFFTNNMGAYIEVGNRGSLGLTFNF